MSRVKMWLLDLLYPNRCDCCGARISYSQRICADCAEQLRKLEISSDAWQKRQSEPSVWDGLAAGYAYESTAKNGILALKRGKRGFLEAAADRLAAQVKNEFDLTQIACITCVPMAKRRRRSQGYAHSEMIAQALGKRLGIPVRCGLLAEQPHGKLRQHQLGAHDRKTFSARFFHTGKDLSGQTVLLCDDVLTTGSTLSYCTELLKQCGAECVIAAALTCRIQQETFENT